MARWRSILAVVTDPFAREQAAATKAAAIAKRCGARLTLVNTFMIPQPVADTAMDARDDIIESAKRQRRERMMALAAKWRRQGMQIKAIVEWDYPAHEAIIRVVLREKPDLLVAHSHRHGKLARWVLANTDWELMRHCPCPMWFVRDATLPARPKLLVGVDPRHAHAKPARLDDRLLAAARTLTGQLGGSIEVVHAYDEPITSTSGALIEPFRPRGTAPAAQALDRDVARLTERYEIDPDSCHVIGGAPAQVLPALASKRKTDVLVMGAVSRSRLERPIIGSTAEKVIDAVGCDVLIVKPAGYKTDVPKVRPR
jgi:universal stress protein E